MITMQGIVLHIVRIACSLAYSIKAGRCTGYCAKKEETMAEED